MIPKQLLYQYSRRTLLCLLLLLPTIAQASPSGTPTKLFEWKPFLAPFHAVVLHFPIGFLTLAGILEIYRMLRPNEEVRRITRLVLWLSLITGIISSCFGLLRAGTGGYESAALDLHRQWGLGVPIATLLTLALAWIIDRYPEVSFWKLAYRSTLLLTLVAVVIAGHYGGNLTHGSKYLVENAPEFVREILEEETPEPSVPTVAAASEKARVYTEKVQPIFQAKCVSCHGAEKQKGGYRVDQPQLALQGGESGKPAIKPNDPLGSHLLQLVLLPTDHDDVMPPSGKTPLTLDEIMVILDWIRNGAEHP